MNVVVPLVADSCVVYLLDENGAISRLEPAHADPAKAELLRAWLAQIPPRLESLIPPVARVLRTGEAEVIARVSAEMMRADPEDLEHRSIADAVGLKSLIVAPLSARGRILGAISYGASTSRRPYSAEDLRFAEELARRAAMAMDNARLHAKMKEAVRAREQVLQVVSHDLRNPLATVVLNASVIAGLPPSAFPEPGVHDLAGSLVLAAEQMEHLIRDLADFARIDAGHLALERRRTRASHLINHALAVHAPLAAKKGIQLEREIAGDLPDVDCESGRVLQVLSNLLGNAIKFTPEGGSIAVRAEAAGAEVQFAVSDSGCGIAPKHLPHLFGRFWKVDRTSRTGAGLGLAIAKGIVEAHGGRIWAESEVGHGTAVFFTLPAAKEEPSGLPIA